MNFAAPSQKLQLLFIQDNREERSMAQSLMNLISIHNI